MHHDEMVERKVGQHASSAQGSGGPAERNDEHRQSRTNISFSRRDIREYTGWANSRVHRYLKELLDFEYLLIESGRNGTICRYRLAYEGQGKDGERFVLGLKEVENLEK